MAKIIQRFPAFCGGLSFQHCPRHQNGSLITQKVILNLPVPLYLSASMLFNQCETFIEAGRTSSFNVINISYSQKSVKLRLKSFSKNCSIWNFEHGQQILISLKECGSSKLKSAALQSYNGFSVRRLRKKILTGMHTFVVLLYNSWGHVGY